MGHGCENIPYDFPNSLKELYKVSNGMYFGDYEKGGGVIDKEDKGWYYSLIPIDKVTRISQDGYCDPRSEILDLVNNWYKIIDCGDGNCLAINLNDNGFGEIIDIFHETVGLPESHDVIAWSFDDWCELHRSSGTHCWWLGLEALKKY